VRRFGDAVAGAICLTSHGTSLTLAAARLHQVPLVVAKVERLTRSVAFLSRLLEAGVDVRFAAVEYKKSFPIPPRTVSKS
jgi:hypothetical protein